RPSAGFDLHGRLTPPGSAAAGFFVSISPRRREHPLPHLGHAIIIAGACRHASVLAEGSAYPSDVYRSVVVGLITLYFFRLPLICKPVLENARVLLKFVSHAAKF
ncbi:hypothetical protein, partial [Methylorubrum sp. DB1722]